MKKVLVTMMAASMFVSSMALAGSIGKSIDASVSASKSITDLSASGIGLILDGTQIVSRATQSVSTVAAGASIEAIGSVEGVSVKVVNASINSTDSKLIQLSGKGIRFAITLTADVARLIPQGAHLILTRSAQGAYVLVIMLGTVAQDALQLDLPEAMVGALKTPVEVLKAMATSHDETRDSLKSNKDRR